jgi:hypothetical protein
MVADCHTAVTGLIPAEAVPARGGNEDQEGRASMSLESHLAELQRKHGEIEREIDEAMTHPSISDGEIAELKRRKLAIKDAIYRMRKIPTRH